MIKDVIPVFQLTVMTKNPSSGIFSKKQFFFKTEMEGLDFHRCNFPADEMSMKQFLSIDDRGSYYYFSKPSSFDRIRYRKNSGFRFMDIITLDSRACLGDVEEIYDFSDLNIIANIEVKANCLLGLTVCKLKNWFKAIDGCDYYTAVTAKWFHQATSFLYKDSDVCYYVKKIIPFTFTPFVSLYEAATNGQIDRVKALLAAHVEVNQANNRGFSPLFIAAYYGHLECAKELIAANADVNQACISGASPLLVAAQNGHMDMVNYLLEAGADIAAVYIASPESLYAFAEKRSPEIQNRMHKFIAEQGHPCNILMKAQDIAAIMSHHEIAELLANKANQQSYLAQMRMN